MKKLPIIFLLANINKTSYYFPIFGNIFVSLGSILPIIFLLNEKTSYYFPIS